MRNKKINKVIFLVLVLIIMLMSNIQKSFAFEIGEKQLISMGECEKLMTYNGTPIRTTYIVYEKDGAYYPAYCLDVNLPGAEGGSYSVTGGSKIQDVNVWRAIINGYPYKTVSELGTANEQEAFTATKQAVYTMLYGRDTNSYGAVNTDAGRRTYQAYLNIVNSARNSTENIENNLQIQLQRLTEEWKVDSKNPNCVSKTYQINSNISGKCEVYTKGLVPNGTIITDIDNNIKNSFNTGEKFKILMPIQNLLECENFTIEVKSNLTTKPVAYGKTSIPGTQDYALAGYMYEEVNKDEIEDYFKNLTKIIVIKKEYGTEERLEGVKFNLLDSNKNIVMENLTTNENGEIILENQIPGTYYLQEIETLENYNLYTDLIEIKLDLNEEFQVTVNNTKREVKKVDKDFKLVEILPTYDETEYNVKTEKNIIKKLPVTGM